MIDLSEFGIRVSDDVWELNEKDINLSKNRKIEGLFCQGNGSLHLRASLEEHLSDAPQNAEYMRMFTEGTHFNPVDLVCAIRDYEGKPFNLPDYVDPQTGFISQKSKNGRNLQALELPGLWNGAMSDWSTIFVEVPLETFNPVKTVNDLLRDEHQ